MSRSLRSTTGCASCKISYEYVEHSESDKHRVKRTRPAPRPASKASAKIPQASRVSLQDIDLTSLPTSPTSGTVPTYPNDLETQQSDEICPNSNLIVPHNVSSLSLTSPPSVHPRQSTSALNPNSSALNCVAPILLAPVALGSVSTIAWDEDEDEGIGEVEDTDPEGVRVLIFTALTVDKNVKDNTLPFVLHCYSQWAIARIFEPLKVAHAMREQVIAQFSSENTRTRTVLIANVMEMFAKNLVIDGARKFILDQLVLDGQKNGSSLAVAPPCDPVLDRYNARLILDDMLEIFSLQIFTQPLAACIQSLDYAAPVFRRACSEPPGKPVNLANLMLKPNMSLTYFASLDIIQSVTTGRPTYIQYEVPFSFELCEQVYRLQGKYGLQWHLGFPDQFILLFAWINYLRERQETGDNSELVTWIETNLPQIRIDIDESGDPLLRVSRVIVQECWRFAVLIYFYMVLCQANAHDPRVVQAQKGFMRLVRGVAPRRNPDAHLSPSMVVVGVATTKERDRETLRQRILGVHEFKERGTVGNDFILQLEDVWARTRDEGRPAVWSDLRVACFRVTGK